MGFGLTCEFNTCGQFVTVELDGLLWGFDGRTAVEIKDRRPVVRAASLHPEPEVKTTFESTVLFKPISVHIAVLIT